MTISKNLNLTGWQNFKKAEVIVKLLNLQNKQNRKLMDNSAHNDHKNLLKGLQSADSLKIIETLEELRTSGKASDIPMLIELLHLSHDAEIKSKITDLFTSLKESDAIPLIIDGIRNRKYAPELKSLISSCWENGMDYSKYIALFIDLLIENELEIALEAYTVIINTENKIDQQVIDQEIERMEKVLPSVSEQKRQLLLDVIDYLPNLRS